MSQHMHNLGSTDHVLTVLPLFHGGGLNIQTTPALHHGATVTIHTRVYARGDACCDRTRQTYAGSVGAYHDAIPSRPSSVADDGPLLTEGNLHRFNDGPAAPYRTLCRAWGAPVLQVYGSTETCPIAVYTRLGGDLARKGSSGLPGLCCEAGYSR
ncbi:AMP-binding protein [Bradyrhizobium sp. LM2.9]